MYKQWIRIKGNCKLTTDKGNCLLGVSTYQETRNQKQEIRNKTSDTNRFVDDDMRK